MPKIIQLDAYKPHPDAEQRRSCVQEIIRTTLTLPLDDDYKSKILRDLIWKYTEADGKHNVRFRSPAATSSKFGTQRELHSGLRHDHVFPISSLVKRLLSCQPGDEKSVLVDAVSCLVTEDEHQKLSKWDKLHPGWGKYHKENISYSG